MHELHCTISIYGPHSQPNNYHFRGLEDSPHELDLATLFPIIDLVDTEGIYPEIQGGSTVNLLVVVEDAMKGVIKVLADVDGVLVEKHRWSV